MDIPVRYDISQSKRKIDSFWLNHGNSLAESIYGKFRKPITVVWLHLHTGRTVSETDEPKRRYGT